MNDETFEDFQIWYDSRPGHITYEEAVNFLVDISSITRGEAELEVGRLCKKDEAKLIKTPGNKILLFLKPLPDITEGMVRDIWDGPPGTEYDLTKMVEKLHYRTGTETEDIYDRLRSMDNVAIGSGKFEWIDYAPD